MTKPPIKLSRLTFVAFNLLATIDEGKSCDLKKVEERAVDRSLTEWLKAEGVEVLPGDEQALDDIFEGAAGGMSRRDYGVERNGYALALAYVLEGIQREFASEPHGWSHQAYIRRKERGSGSQPE